MFIQTQVLLTLRYVKMAALCCVLTLLVAIGVVNSRYFSTGGYYGGGIQGGSYRYGQGFVGGFGPQSGPRFGFQIGWGGGRSARPGYIQGPFTGIGGTGGYGSYRSFGSWPLLNGGPGRFMDSAMIGGRFGPGNFGYGNIYGGRSGFGRQGNLDIGGLRSIAGRFRQRRMRPFGMGGQAWRFGGGFSPLYGNPSTSFGAYSFGYGNTRMGVRPSGYRGFGRGWSGRSSGTRFGGDGFGGFGRIGPGGPSPGVFDGLGDDDEAGFGAPRFSGGIAGNFDGGISSGISLPFGKQNCECRKQCRIGERFAGKCKGCTKKLCLVRCCQFWPF